MRVKVRDLGVLDIYRLLLFSTKAKPFREENKVYDHLVEEYSSLIGGKSYPAVQWFFMNLCKARKKGFKAMRIRLRAEYWSGNVAGIGARKVKEVVEWFEFNEYIIVYPGNNDKLATWKSYPTIVEFTPKLLDLIDMQAVQLYIPDEGLSYPIIVKDRKTKEVIPSGEDHEALEQMEKEMNTYNDSFKDVVIKFDDVEIPSLEYKRSFSGDLFKGGRLFAHGGSIQLLPERYRLEYLTLDDEKVVEIDYKAIHANILLECLAQSKPEVYDIATTDFDPYGADRSFMNVDEKAVAKHKAKFGIPKYDPVRNLYKRALLMAINCESPGKTRNSINHELYKDSKLEDMDRRYVGLINPDVEKILDALCEHNELIEDNFYKDYGVVLQSLDSRIALRVIDLLIQEGETCLAYHDSFAVKSSVEPLLEYAMKQAWKDVLGENKFCYLDKK